MDTRLAILSAAAFAGVVVGGALIADPGLTAGLRGDGQNSTSQLVNQGVDSLSQGGQPTDAVFTTAASTSGTGGHDEHERGRSKDDARRSSGEREHEDDEDDD